MAQDWAADVRRYHADADDTVINGIVRHCGIALQKPDSSLVSFSDPAEMTRVRNNFLKKKCGLTDSDEVLDAGIAKVGERMRDDTTKNRVTAYYLLADHFGRHDVFSKPAKRAAAVATVGAGAGSAATLAALDGGAVSPAVPDGSVERDAFLAQTAGPSTAAPYANGTIIGTAAGSSAGLSALGNWGGGTSPLGRKLNLGGASDGSGVGLAWAALLGFGLLALFWLGASMWPRQAEAPVASVTTVAAAPDAIAQTIPEGAGIIRETRNKRPVLKVYFDTGKAVVVDDFAAEATAVKAYLDANPGTVIGVSGYNDPTGNAAANAELSKNRAQAVQAALVRMGVPAAAIELIKPEATTDAAVTREEARRVEVYIK